MGQSQQKRLFLDLLEGAPSIVFILLWRQTGEMETAGWAGCGLTFAVFIIFLKNNVRMHPVLLGVNLHILLATPVLVGLFRFGNTDLAGSLTYYAYPAVLLTVTLTGLVQAAYAKGGFAGLPECSRSAQHRLSLAMLTISSAGTVWGFVSPDEALLPVVATLTLLIGGRRFVLARLSDKSSNGLLIAAMIPEDSVISDSA